MDRFFCSVEENASHLFLLRKKKSVVLFKSM